MRLSKVDAGSLYGTLNLLILQSLAEAGPLHGLGIANRILAVSQDVLRIEEGALYPALHRLQRDDQLEAHRGISDKGRRAKLYEITAAGRDRVADEANHWVQHTEAIARVLKGAAEGLA